MSVPEARHIGIGIACGLADARAFLADPRNLPKWAGGLCRSVEPDGDCWIVESPTGRARLAFAPPNDFGVLDHTVFPAPGVEVRVPMRVMANGDGCEVVLTLYRQPGMTPEDFERDAALVGADLRALKTLLESGGARVPQR